MSRKLLLAVVVAVFGLSGCIAVPVYEAPPPYGHYHGPPAATVTFGYYGTVHRQGPVHRHVHRR